MIYTKLPTTLDTYVQTEQQFFEHLTQTLGDHLLLYCVTGSLATHTIIPNWSDLDILIVVDDYEDGVLEAIQSAVQAYDSHFKIGTTSYSKQEFGSPDYLDTKTLIAINRIRQTKYTPRQQLPDILLPPVTEDDIRCRERARFSEYIHKLKRGIQQYSPASERELYKQIIDLLKIAIRSEADCDPASYDEVLHLAERHLPDWNGRLFPVQTILDEQLPPEERKAAYLQVLAWFTSHERCLAFPSARQYQSLILPNMQRSQAKRGMAWQS